jgi:hypothetical protein
MSAQSWEYTRGYAGVFGTVPTPFATTIRTLLSEESAGLAQPSASTLYQLLRLMKSPSLFAPFYFAADTFCPSVLSSTSRTPEAAVIKAFSCSEVASLLGVIYLSRRAQALCDAEELKSLEGHLIEEANLSFLVGRAIPAIGGGMSLLQATAHILGLAAFLRHDPSGFKEHRRLLKKEDLRWDCNLEMERWGCTRIQVGSVLMQSLGFGIKRANAIAHGLGCLSQTGAGEEMELAYDVKMAALWCEAIRTTRKAPEVPLPANYYPTHNALQEVIATLDTLKRAASLSSWLQKRKDDLPPYQQQDSTGRPSSGQAADEFEAMQADLTPIDSTGSSK